MIETVVSLRQEMARNLLEISDRLLIIGFLDDAEFGWGFNDKWIDQRCSGYK